METVRLRYIGYWHSLESPDFPDPAWFVDAAWDEGEKKKVLQYLKQSFPTPWVYMGRSWCRFRCGKDVLGCGEYTDGKFVWPEGLTHYIEDHRVRLPQEVIGHMLTGKRPVNVAWNDALKENIDFSWWLAQKGWNQELKSYPALTNIDIGTVTICQLDQSNIEAQFVVLKAFLFKAQGFPYRLRQVKRILAGEQVNLTGRFLDYEPFRDKASQVGLRTDFSEMPYHKYMEMLNKDYYSR